MQPKLDALLDDSDVRKAALADVNITASDEYYDNYGPFYEMGKNEGPEKIRQIQKVLVNTNVINEMLFILYGLTDINSADITGISISYLGTGNYKFAHKITVTIKGHDLPYSFVLKESKKSYVTFDEEAQDTILSTQINGKEGIVSTPGKVYNLGEYHCYTEQVLEGLQLISTGNSTTESGVLLLQEGESVQAYQERARAIIQALATALFNQAKLFDFKRFMDDTKIDNFFIKQLDDGSYEATIADMGSIARLDSPAELIIFMQKLFQKISNAMDANTRQAYNEIYSLELVLDAIVKADPEVGIDFVRQAQQEINTIVAEESAKRQQDGLVLLHGSNNPFLDLDRIKIFGREGKTKQGKKGRNYGGFYAVSIEDLSKAENYAKMKEGTPTIYEITVNKDVKIYEAERNGEIERLSEARIQELLDQGYGMVRGKNILGTVTEWAIIDKKYDTAYE